MYEGEHVIVVPNDGIQEHAERLLTGPVPRGALAIGFSESRASSVETLVEGRSFYPRMLEDIASASSSVHINQFGFRPGVAGDAFAEALIAKAAEGVPVRLVVDRQGSDPERSSRVFYDRLTGAGVQVCVVRATKPRSRVGQLGAGGAMHWNLGGLGHIDHRKFTVVDGRIGWVGGAGIEDHFQDGRFHDLFLRVTGPVVNQLQLVFLASFRWLGGEVPVAEIESLFPSLEAGAESVPAVVLHNAPGRYRPITDAIAGVLENARETLDVVNPYVTDRGMIRRMEQAARRGVRVRLFVPANANNWACAAAQQFHHGALLDAGRSHPRVPGHAACEGIRARRRGAPRRNVQPRGLEPEALLRDRPPGLVEGRRVPVRRAVLRAGGGSVVSRPQAHRDTGEGQGHGLRGPLAFSLSSDSPSLAVCLVSGANEMIGGAGRVIEEGRGDRDISAQGTRARARSGGTSSN